MTELQEDFLSELKSKPKFSVTEYAELYAKHSNIAIEEELKNGADKFRAKAMGNYYTVAILSNFLDNENKLARVIALHESKKSD
ncbi:hypothetical protein N9A28_00925 [Sulfurimonas sp.]|nr:hypothetical protein [Sulfurimonas sp.]